MHLICESPLVEDYLKEDDIVNVSHPVVWETLSQLQLPEMSEIERIRQTYEFVRDTIPHSCDLPGAQVTRVTCQASEVLKYGTGICYAKAHLLAALLRGQSIPTGFCYQRLMQGTTPEMGYAIHALNAVYLPSQARWIRLDARGNKPGVQAAFSTQKEQLAFSARAELGEIDYSTIYVRPHPETVKSLKEHSDDLYGCLSHLPDHL